MIIDVDSPSNNGEVAHDLGGAGGGGAARQRMDLMERLQMTIAMEESKMDSVAAQMAETELYLTAKNEATKQDLLQLVEKMRGKVCLSVEEIEGIIGLMFAGLGGRFKFENSDKQVHNDGSCNGSSQLRAQYGSIYPDFVDAVISPEIADLKEGETLSMLDLELAKFFQVALLDCKLAPLGSSLVGSRHEHAQT